MMRVPPVEKGDNEAGIGYAGLFREKPLRCDRSEGPSTLPASCRKGLPDSACRAFSKASLTRLPRERPVARARSSIQRARSPLKRILSVVLMGQKCRAWIGMSRACRLEAAWDHQPQRTRSSRSKKTQAPFAILARFAVSIRQTVTK